MSSMFPATRYVCSGPGTPNDASNEDLSGSARLLVPGRISSSTRIPKDALSMPINPKSLLGSTDVVHISVGANTYGTMELESSSKSVWPPEVHWVRALRIAEDCHCYNIELRIVPHNTSKEVEDASGNDCSLVLQAVRPVQAGQELLLWFSDELLALMHVPFLTPGNIQGEKNYVCTKCSALYESPNPLKLHLALDCGRYTITKLWEKLSHSLLEAKTKVPKPAKFRFKLEPVPPTPNQQLAIDLSTPQETRMKQETKLYRPYNTTSVGTGNSAFKPFNKFENQINNNTINTYVGGQNYMHWPRFTMPTDYMHTPMTINQAHCDDEAQIESLVSSLGKFKEGHICLYCGKSYSRKYGLKIHIRTHTGYKPLKCKFCLRPFGDPSNLNKHVRLHAEGETPYKCDLCGKVLVRRRDLDRHLKSRHMHDMNPTTSVTDEESNETASIISDDEQDKIVVTDK